MNKEPTKWKCEGASVTGPSHAQNQDRFGADIFGGRLVIVVCDGAGAARNSATGAEVALEAALKRAKSWEGGNESDMSLLVKTIVHDASEALGGDRSMACTLSVVVVDEQWCGVGLVGDSPVFLSRDGVTQYLEATRESEFINETAFLTSEDRAERIEVYPSYEIDAVVVASDGLSAIVVKNGEALKGFFAPLFTRMRSDSGVAVGLLEHLRETRRTYDDTTMVVAVRER